LLTLRALLLRSRLRSLRRSRSGCLLRVRGNRGKGNYGDGKSRTID
jgi:hypothetical protein